MANENKSNEYQIAIKLLPLVGGVTNVDDVTNCMTRLRLKVKDGSKVKVDDIKKVPGVLGLISDGTLYQIVLGPGRVRKVTEEFNALVKTAQEVAEEVHSEENKKVEEKKAQPITGNKFVRFFKRIGRFIKTIKWKRGLRHIGNIFSPLVPGFICFGIFYSIRTIILITTAGTGADPMSLTGAAAAFYWLFYALSFGFMSYLHVFIGINAAKEFNATPSLGGILGGISIVPELMVLAKTIGWDLGGEAYSLIAAGRGGVFTVILAVFIMSFIERLIRKRMPNVLDTVFSPLLTIIVGACLLIFIIMPVMGYVSNGIVYAVSGFQGLHPAIKAISGFFMAGLFLPLVMLGLHHGLTSIYMTMMENNILYPIFAMADAAQFGVGMAILLKSRKYKHDRLKENAAAGVIPQALGVSEPLIYGVTLPLFKPFITVGIGAALGGAFIAAMGIGFSGFDVSGLLGILLASKITVNGVVQDAPVMARVWYFVGWLIAATGGFVSTWLMISEKDLNRLPRYDTFVNKA